MKSTRIVFGICLAAFVVAAACSCRTSGSKELKTDIHQYEDSTAHSKLAVKAELPVSGKGTASDRIRASLIEVMDGQLSHIGTYEEDRMFPSFEGDSEDSDMLLEYYCKKALETIGRLSQEDYDERIASIEGNDDLTEAEKEEILADMPGWEYSFSLLKNRETDRYVVFLSEDYVYLGGAHGGIIGRGPMTFDKKDGNLVERFLEPSCLEAIQPLLRKGLSEYFSEGGMEVSPEGLDDILMLESGSIPLPAWPPFPSEDGLVFTYQQYEIASYAAGMPNFTVPYGDILPYLTQEAKGLLDLKD